MKDPKENNFEINILGLIKLKVKDWTFRQILIMVTILVIFLTGVIILLKLYAIPLLGIASIKDFIVAQIGAYIKSKIV